MDRVRGKRRKHVSEHVSYSYPVMDAVARYEPESGDSQNNVWYDCCTNTRASGDWSGQMVMMPGDWPVFDGVADVCGTGQGTNPMMFTGLDYFYPEYPPATPMEFASGTVECWVKADAAVTGLADALQYHYLYGIGYQFTGAGTYFGYRFASPATFVSSGVAVDVSWHHLVLRFTTGGAPSADFFVDGVKVVTGGSFAAASAVQRAWYIGDNFYSNAPWKGSLDCARFYDRHLSDDEVLTNYQQGVLLHT